MDQEKVMQLLRRIPGFRSWNPWKMAAATITYLVVLSALLAEPGSLFMLLGLVGFIVGLVKLFKGIVTKVPLKSAVIVLIISLILLGIGSAALPADKGQTAGRQPVVAGNLENSKEVEAENPPAEAENETELPKEPVKEAENTDKENNPAPPFAAVPAGQMKVHFIDVGQGDSILIQTPKQNILIDGGERGNIVVEYLSKNNVNSLDLVISTHPHADHIGGLINVLQKIAVKEVIDPGVVHTTKTFEEYLTLIDEKDIIFTEGRAGMRRELGGGAKMELLHPQSPSGSNVNDASIVVRLTFGEVGFLLAGDAEQASLRQIISRNNKLRSTILKVSHHGSRTGLSAAFLSAVSPKAAVIMCGKGNPYGHPHAETLTLLAEAKVDIYRTDLHGTIVISTDGKKFAVNNSTPYQYHPPQAPDKPKETVKPQSNPPATVPETEARADPAPAPAPQPEPQPEPTPPTKGNFVGSHESDKYHYPSCRSAKQIKAENELWFTSVQDARAANYVPCGVCKPPLN
jgi:competence protein ComEC